MQRGMAQNTARSNHRTAFGYEAKLLPKVCGVVLDADKAGALKSEDMAGKAETSIRAFSTVGVIALIDEATGYPLERAIDELAKMEAYLQEEFRPR